MDDTRTSIASISLTEPMMMMFPKVRGVPWIERAEFSTRLRIVVIHGRSFSRTEVVSRSFLSVTPHLGIR